MSTTAREHLDWCVQRAMEYAGRGDMTNAWASFASDVGKHDGTAWIQSDELFAMAMMSGVYKRPDDFRRFIAGWNVRDGG